MGIQLQRCHLITNSRSIEAEVSPEMVPRVTGPELQLLVQHDITPTYRRYEWFVSV